MLGTTKTLIAVDPPSTADGAVLVETDRLVLRRVKPTDGAAVHAIAGHPEVIRCLTDRWADNFSLQDAEATLTRWAEARAQTDPHYPTSLLICAKNAGDPDAEPEPIGSIGLTPGTSVEYRTWTLGYILMPASWGQGYATEAVRALTRYVFRNWPKLMRIEAKLYAWNEASNKVVNRSGFVFEGRRRSALERHGKVADDLVYGLVRTDVEAEL